MRETRPSGSEGGAGSIPVPTPITRRRAQKLKVSVTRRLRPGWVKRGRSTLWLCGGGK